METSPNFNQETANEFAFKRDNVWSTLALRCCIPSHPHDWDHLSLISNSVLLQLLGINLTQHCLGLNSIIFWPQYSVSFQYYPTESQSITWVLVVELQPQSLLMNLCPRMCLAHYSKYPDQYLELKHNTKADTCLSAHLSIIPRIPAAVLCLPIGTSYHFILDPFLLLLICWDSDQRLLDPILARLHLHCQAVGQQSECKPIPKEGSDQSPIPPRLPLLLLVTGHAPIWPTEITLREFGYLCCVVGESDCSPVHVTQL